MTISISVQANPNYRYKMEVNISHVQELSILFHSLHIGLINFVRQSHFYASSTRREKKNKSQW